jgi:acyl carrier protein
MESKEKFLAEFKEALEMDESTELTMHALFREIDEWDSLARLSLIALLDDEYEVVMESSDLEGLVTIQDLFNWVSAKKA